MTLGKKERKMILIAKCRTGYPYRYHGRPIKSPQLIKKIKNLPYLFVCPERLLVQSILGSGCLCSGWVFLYSSHFFGSIIYCFLYNLSSFIFKNRQFISALSDGVFLPEGHERKKYKDFL